MRYLLLTVLIFISSFTIVNASIADQLPNRPLEIKYTSFYTLNYYNSLIDYSHPKFGIDNIMTPNEWYIDRQNFLLNKGFTIKNINETLPNYLAAYSDSYNRERNMQTIQFWYGYMTTNNELVYQKISLNQYSGKIRILKEYILDINGNLKSSREFKIYAGEWKDITTNSHIERIINNFITQNIIPT